MCVQFLCTCVQLICACALCASVFMHNRDELQSAGCLKGFVCLSVSLFIFIYAFPLSMSPSFPMHVPPASLRLPIRPSLSDAHQSFWLSLTDSLSHWILLWLASGSLSHGGVIIKGPIPLSVGMGHCPHFCPASAGAVLGELVNAKPPGYPVGPLGKTCAEPLLWEPSSRDMQRIANCK